MFQTVLTMSDNVVSKGVILGLIVRLAALTTVSYLSMKLLMDAVDPTRKQRLAAQKKAEKLARERELAKIAISKEDVDLIMSEMELPKDKAERTLREHGGDVVKALTALVNAPF